MDTPIFSDACGRQDVTLHPKLPVLLVTVRPEAFDDLGRAIRIERRRDQEYPTAALLLRLVQDVAEKLLMLWGVR